VRAFARASSEGWQSYLADPAPVNRLLRRLNSSMDDETMAAAAAAQKPLIETDETAARGLGAMTVERWATLANQLHDLGFIERAPTAAELVAPM